MTNALAWQTHELEIDTCNLRIAAMQRPGTATPILFLHGFGSTKED